MDGLSSLVPSIPFDTVWQQNAPRPRRDPSPVVYGGGLSAPLGLQRIHLLHGPPALLPGLTARTFKERHRCCGVDLGRGEVDAAHGAQSALRFLRHRSGTTTAARENEKLAQSVLTNYRGGAGL
jgi:hypothetical protein